jgi:Zn-dependent protease
MLGYFLTLEYLKSMIYIAPAILLAITAHEFAHGYVSYKLGDPTPKRDGRLSLNPLAHLDLWGTICLILFRMGWAKPVRINPSSYRDRKKGTILFLLLVTGILRIPLNRVNTAVLDGMWNVVKKILKILIFPSYQSGSYI